MAITAKSTRGGRPRVFVEPTTRLNLFLPVETAKRIRIMAIQEGMSPSQFVDDLASKADLILGLARGDRDFAEGRVVSQKEAERRLSKWG